MKPDVLTSILGTQRSCHLFLEATALSAGPVLNKKDGHIRVWGRDRQGQGDRD